MSGLGLTFLRRGGQAHPTAGSDYIKFADAEVERILIANGVSSDGVGITKDDAARVTSFAKAWFQSNKVITSFDELKYFLNVKSLSDYQFSQCDNLVSIDLQNVTSLGNNSVSACPSLVSVGSTANLTEFRSTNAFLNCTSLKAVDLRNVTKYSNAVLRGCTSLETIGMIDKATDLAAYTFYNCSALKDVIVAQITPPTIAGTTFSGTTCIFYVPDESLEAYKVATTWKNYWTNGRLKPMSEYNG